MGLTYNLIIKNEILNINYHNLLKNLKYIKIILNFKFEERK
jgi:hypothetical protein